MHIKNTTNGITAQANQFDYYMVNLNTHQIQKITAGEDKNIKYNVQISKDQYPVSPWNLKFAMLDEGSADMTDTARLGELADSTAEMYVTYKSKSDM